MHFDMTGETEHPTVVYTIKVLCPERPQSKWIPGIFTRKPIKHPKTSSTLVIRPQDTNPNLDCFQLKDLKDMKSKVVKIESGDFSCEMRCWHVQTDRICTEGCYVLELGGSIRRWKCRREDCEGHVYVGSVKENNRQNVCFGKKGARMVCVRRWGGL
ncbi:hypothetical protein GQ44DRAFT_676050 [Phaeosphaeriaceae sp. PMI808]|nr:hypothetical protein GQ44DRAFT_676050 [Phaeosphaeriaceae sp. PMI808]